VFEVLGGTPLSHCRDLARRLVAGARRQGDVPALGELASFEQWLAARLSPTHPPVYALAFLAADELVTRHGLPAVISYFSPTVVDQGWAGADAFEAAFGESVGDVWERVRATR
jgi:hypothetical protein